MALHEKEIIAVANQEHLFLSLTIEEFISLCSFYIISVFRNMFVV